MICTGMCRVAGIELEIVEHRPAEHVGQEDIERDGRGLELPGQRQARWRPGGDDALEALVARQAEQDAGVVRIVLDDEQDGVASSMSSRSSAMCSSRATGSTVSSRGTDALTRGAGRRASADCRARCSGAADRA